jgi:hypothetical protein
MRGGSMSKALLIVLAAATLIHAQSERGNIVGAVTDGTGANMPNVAVTIVNKSTNISTHILTTSSGEYTAPNLSPGEYRIEISAAGFRRYAAEGITLTAGATIRLDAQLQLGQLTESIEVKAEAAQLQTEDAKVSTSVENRMVDQLPLVVGGALRSPFDLVSTVPEAKGSGSSVSLGGGQAASWSATLDGLSVIPTARPTPAKPPISRLRWNRSPNSRWTPTGSRPSMARPAVE